MSMTSSMSPACAQLIAAWDPRGGSTRGRSAQRAAAVVLATVLFSWASTAGAAETSASSASSQAGGSKATATALPELLPGQRTVMLADGSILITGLPGGVLKATGAAIEDPTSGQVTPLPSGPAHPRAWHTATVLPDGSVLLLGGIDASGNLVDTAERFDPSARSFEAVDHTGLITRVHQSATLLTDGTVLIAGGVTARGAPVLDAELWNPRTGTSQPVSAQAASARLDATATLLTDGTVWIAGGTDAAGHALGGGERYEPLVQRFVRQDNPPPELAQSAGPPQVSGTLPQADSHDIALDAQIAVRFNQALKVDTINPNSIRLEGPGGAVDAAVVPAESGRLAFVTPSAPLQPSSTYTPLLFGAQDALGRLLAPLSFSFQTGTRFEFDSTQADNQASGSATKQNRLFAQTSG